MNFTKFVPDTTTVRLFRDIREIVRGEGFSNKL